MKRRSNARKNLSLTETTQSPANSQNTSPITNRVRRTKSPKQKPYYTQFLGVGSKIVAIIVTLLTLRFFFRHDVRDRTVVVQGIRFQNDFFPLPDLPQLNNDELEDLAKPDYGDLEIQFLAEMNVPRVIYVDPLEWESDWEPHEADTNEDDFDTYYAFDDDIQRNPYRDYEDDYIKTSKHCRRVAWHRNLPINCNAIHEFDFLQYVEDGVSEFTGEGAYRQVHWVELDNDPPVAFKKFKWDAAYDFRDFEFMRMDALVAEVLTAEPDIVDIYGFCALAILNEAMIGGDLEAIATPMDIERGSFVERHDEDGVHPLNNLTATEKLVYSLEMAEALSKLHSYPGGIIVHDDIHLGQFLLDDFGHLKLHDFNRAEIMLWNEEDGEYCRYRNNPGDGEVSQ